MQHFWTSTSCHSAVSSPDLSRWQNKTTGCLQKQSQLHPNAGPSSTQFPATPCSLQLWFWLSPTGELHKPPELCTDTCMPTALLGLDGLIDAKSACRYQVLPYTPREESKEESIAVHTFSRWSDSRQACVRPWSTTSLHFMSGKAARSLLKEELLPEHCLLSESHAERPPLHTKEVHSLFNIFAPIAKFCKQSPR